MTRLELNKYCYQALALINRLMCTHFWSGSILLSHVYEIEQAHFPAGGGAVWDTPMLQVFAAERESCSATATTQLKEELTQLAFISVRIFGRLIAQNPSTWHGPWRAGAPEASRTLVSFPVSHEQSFPGPAQNPPSKRRAYQNGCKPQEDRRDIKNKPSH